MVEIETQNCEAPISTKASRELACRLAAQVCQGQSPSGIKLLSYVILFENYIDLGADKAGEIMSWNVTETAPISLAEVRKNMKLVLDDEE